MTCSNLTLEVNGAPVWVENLTKACPTDAPDWFRFNTSNSLEVNIASFTCTNACTISLQLENPVKALTVRPKSLRVAVTGQDRDWSLALPGPGKLYVEAESLPPLLVFADPPESDPSPDLPAVPGGAVRTGGLGHRRLSHHLHHGGAGAGRDGWRAAHRRLEEAR